MYLLRHRRAMVRAVHTITDPKARLSRSALTTVYRTPVICRRMYTLLIANGGGYWICRRFNRGNPSRNDKYLTHEYTRNSLAKFPSYLWRACRRYPARSVRLNKPTMLPLSSRIYTQKLYTHKPIRSIYSLDSNVCRLCEICVKLNTYRYEINLLRQMHVTMRRLNLKEIRQLKPKVRAARTWLK